MNDQAEEVYERMFHPNEIPQAVRELHDRTQFFVSRVDGQGMRLSQLALIAGIATMNRGAKDSPQLKAHLDAMVDTNEADPQVGDVASLTVATGKTNIDPAAPAPGVPSGPMDAPAKPMKNANPLAHLPMMTQPELRAHAKDFYGLQLPRTTKKAQCIAAITRVEKARATERKDE